MNRLRKTDYTLAVAFGVVVFMLAGLALSNIWIALMLAATAFFAALPNRVYIHQSNQQAIEQEAPTQEVQYYFPSNRDSVTPYNE